MKNDLTELVFILDRSGSMCSLTSDTIGGFNSLIEKQKREDGRAYVTTVLFDTSFDRIHDRVDLQSVKPMTEKDYVAGGCTALLDAVGDTVRHIAHIHKYARSEDVPEKTVVVITTAGLENASHHWSADEVRRLIAHEQEKYGWEFIFLGANIDAVESAGNIGIRPDRSANFMPDARGLKLSFMAAGNVMRSARRREEVSPCWSADVDSDYSDRGGD